MESSQARELQLHQTRIVPCEIGEGGIMRLVDSLVELSQRAVYKRSLN